MEHFFPLVSAQIDGEPVQTFIPPRACLPGDEEARILVLLTVSRGVRAVEVHARDALHAWPF